MPPRVKIRGSYSTAITRLLLDHEYPVVDPSPKICERFGLAVDNAPADVKIHDKNDRQGIELIGEPERVTQFFTFLQEHLTDVVLLQLETLEEPDNLVKAMIEFPADSKRALDEARSAVCSTLLRHHRLRVIDSHKLDVFEDSLARHPERRTLLEQQSFREMIMLPLERGGVFRLEHIRPTGRRIRPREGIIVEADEDHIIFKRSFSAGRYDGLDLPIEKGDYGLTEIREGSWSVRHAYFSREKTLKGEYFNINTAVELYPYGARYMDLEVDVIRRAGEQPVMIDREKLSILVHEGRLSKALETKALQIAEELMQSL
ncbi:MAG: DUF402 domain-containing protein [Desulforhabdus sp.]|jgi:hypothetical protein|nr:DUF402 domain-containing protein [Desulforhabdus sp.]